MQKSAAKTQQVRMYYGSRTVDRIASRQLADAAPAAYAAVGAA